MFKRKKAFTMGEIITAMVLIGVISAICIPIVNGRDNQKNVIAWRNTFQDFKIMGKNMAWDNEGSIVGIASSNSDHNSIKNAMLSHIKYTKDCNTGVTGCWHKAYNWKKLSGVKENNDASAVAANLILSNGTYVSIRNQSASCTSTETVNNDNCASIYIDVNGKIGPNIIGKDIFALRLLRDGLVVPYGTPGDITHSNLSTYSCDVATYSNTNGLGCSAFYLYNEMEK